MKKVNLEQEFKYFDKEKEGIVKETHFKFILE